MDLPPHIAPLTTPLADLHEALENPEQSEKFYADPLWWSAVDEIDRKRVQNPSSAEYRNVRLMVKELLLFIVGFVLFFGWMYLQSDSTLVFVQESQQRFARPSNGLSVDTIDKYWDWLLTDFVSSAYPDSLAENAQPVYIYQTQFAHNNFTIPFSPRQLSAATYLMGAMQIKKSFARPRSCSSSLFASVTTECFETLPTGEEKFMLPVNKTQTVSRLETLRQQGFVDFATRQVLLDFASYTVPSIVTYHSLVLDIYPTGLVKMTRAATVVPLRFISWQSNIGLAIYDVIILSVFVVFLVYTLSLVRRLGLRYVLNMNTILDLLILALTLVYIVLRVWIYAISPANKDALHPEHYVDLHLVASHYMLIKSVLGFIGMALVFKCLKYARFFDQFRILSDTIDRAMPLVLIYSGLLVFICVAFTLSLHVVGHYPTLTESFSVVIASLFSRILLIKTAWFSSNSIAPAVAMLFIVLVWLGILMLFYGAIISAYSLVLHRIHKLHERRSHALDFHLQQQNVVSVFLHAWNSARKNRGNKAAQGQVTSLRSLETNESAAADDTPTQITLEKLPGLVVKKWLDKRQRLHRVVESNLVRQSATNLDAGIFKGRSHGSLEHQMSSFSRSSHTDIKSGNSGNKILPKLKGAINQALALPGAHEFDLPPPPMPPSKITRMYPIDTESESMSDTVVTVSQLQRLMDEDRVLVRLLGTRKASEVIQKFNNAPASPKIKTPQKAPIEQLQSELYKKLDKIEKSGLSLDSIELHEPAIKELSTELGAVLFQTLSEWRGEMAEIGEIVNVLGDGVKGMSGNVQTVIDKYQRMVSLVQTHVGKSSSPTGKDANIPLTLMPPTPKTKLNSIKE